ncbi:hypothetical protein BDW02DRAFT_566404 [Decorospora gaudefroyi]|uniref:Uncharacterized protein n=1 Tax=Decorospora gaudefroyi TaxID=184978 RepID=A0A6A5KMM7_9PLEO|nr:hypothetical protein BDW02DRAFT_566404 [Decorospora gaudefroyi]
MSTFLKSPNSPSPHTFYHDENTPRNRGNHKPNLSGATMSELRSGPEGSTATTSNVRLNRTSKARQSLHVSSTESQLRLTNRMLVGMLQDVQAKLDSQREAMLDMQARLFQLERIALSTTEPYAVPNTETPYAKRLETKCAEDLSCEVQKWWETYQQHAENRDPSFNATDFLQSPSRFSGFDFNFDLLTTIPPAPHTTPELDDLPSLTPTSSEKHARPTAFTPGNRRIPPRTTRTPSSDPTTMYHNAVSDIKEHVIEFNRISIPIPPLLQTPPRSARSKMLLSSAAHDSEEDDEITALPHMPPQSQSPPVASSPPPLRATHKGIKCLFMYKPLLKSGKRESGQNAGRRSGSSLLRN